MLSPQASGPTQSQLSRPMSSRHHISMEYQLPRKQLNSVTNARKQKKKNIFSKEKGKKRKNKIQEKKKKKKKRKKRGKEKEKRPQRGASPRWAQKLIFYKRTVKRNRNPNKEKYNERK